MENKYKIFKEFSRVGKLLFQQGLISLTAGNLSVRKGDKIYITASGSMLGDLRHDEVVVISMKNNGIYSEINQKKPSVEIVVHRSIYENTAYKAIVHAHAPHAIALSFENNKIELADSEGKYYIPEVPVVGVNGGIASIDVANVVPSVLEKYPAVVIRGHGIFAAADTIIQACSLVSTIEFSSQILYKMFRKT